MENIILVDTADRPVGICEKLEAHAKPMLHRAFSIFLYSDGQMLLQGRNRNKYHSGGLWANACCSHPRAGETLEEAASRRLREELGIQAPLTELFSFLYFAQFSKHLFEYEYDHVFLGKYSGTPDFNPDEAEEMRWVQFSQLRRELVEHPEAFSVWFLSAAPRVLDCIEAQSKPPAVVKQ